jgi:mannose-6-phosphate isomerase
MLKIKCATQNYEWGKIGSNSKVFQLASKQGESCDESKPYAGENQLHFLFLLTFIEFWMGDYQTNGSIVIHKDNSEESLYEYIQRNKEEILGINGEFDTLPYLFKVCIIIRRKLSKLISH